LQSLKLGQVIDQDLGNTLHKCSKVISSLLEAAQDLASGEHNAIVSPGFRCLAVYREIAIHMHMLSCGGAPIQIIESVTSEAKRFKHALGGVPKMKFSLI
jgi:hypothetical protein